jgi:hypothetical protein
MVQRIVKLIGDAYSTSGEVQVQVTFNGTEVLNGPVSTSISAVMPNAADFADGLLSFHYNELGQFEITTDVTGSIPVTISVTGGTLFFTHFAMNYTGYQRALQQNNPNIPIDPTNPGTYTRAITTSPDSYYGDPNNNTVESDGVSNLKLNNQTWNYRANVDQSNDGNWTYPVLDGDTITFDFFVDPALIILEVPSD